MRTVSGAPPLAAIKIVRVPDSGTEENFQPGLFGAFARLAYPENTDAVLACLGGVSTRSARAWMSGEASVPAFIAAACFFEIMRRCRCKGFAGWSRGSSPGS